MRKGNFLFVLVTKAKTNVALRNNKDNFFFFFLLRVSFCLHVCFIAYKTSYNLPLQN